MADHLLVERTGHIVVVTMNRPEARNAFSPQMLVGLADAWDLIDGDKDVRAAILTGAGGMFCTGADLKTMSSNVSDPDISRRMKEDAGLAWKALLRHHSVNKPLLAAVEGFAVGGGTEILQATDIRVAGESATFGVPEVCRGLFPLGGSTVRLRRQIGFTNAMELLLTGDTISAPRAKEIGLVGHVVPDGQALDEAMKIAEHIARNSPLAVAAVKRSVMESEGLSQVDALAVELEIGMPIFGTNESREGTKAFAEKREPNYTGT
jgi:enoyl-CoA hydratase